MQGTGLGTGESRERAATRLFLGLKWSSVSISINARRREEEAGKEDALLEDPSGGVVVLVEGVRVALRNEVTSRELPPTGDGLGLEST